MGTELSLPARTTSPPSTAPSASRDRYDRPLSDLRISLTDRCNLRCTYCMPRELFGADHEYLSNTAVLSLDEIGEIARVAWGMGVRKIRLTGGEPLLRPDLPVLIRELATLPDLDLALTTNGIRLPKMAQALADAGLRRVTVSLDSLDDERFQAMTDSRSTVADVIAGIDAAAEAGLGPVKINTVIKQGVNDEDILSIAERFRFTGHTVRFIEFMDVGATNGWAVEQVHAGQKVLETISAKYPLTAVTPSHPGEVASRFRYLDGGGEIGVITSVTAPFCGDCSRARLSADGQLFTCLFASKGTDLRSVVRGARVPGDLETVLASTWKIRADRYSEQRSKASNKPRERIEMSYIGG